MHASSVCRTATTNGAVDAIQKNKESYQMNACAVTNLQDQMASNLIIEQKLTDNFGFVAPRGASVDRVDSDCCSSNNQPTNEG